MTENKLDSAAKSFNWEALIAATDAYQKQPWLLYKAPFQVSDNIWYVGNQFVACYIIDTGDGLVLLDTAFHATTAQLVHNIHITGHNPRDIKYIFLSHAHVDHCGGARYMQSLSSENVRTFLGKDDMFFLNERRELILAGSQDMVPDFCAEAYDYDTPMQIGNTCFRFIHTPGHTPGCTTFTFNTTIGGEPLKAAMHGGLGVMLASYKILKRYQLPLELHNAFLAQLERCKTMEVDLVIPSHNKDWNIFALAEKDDGSHRCFIDRTAWSSIMDAKAAALKKLEGLEGNNK